MREKKGKTNLSKILGASYGLCFGGLVLLALGCGISYRWDTARTPGIVVGVLGLLTIVAGLVLAGARLRCPYCDASLMSGGRFPLPTDVPNFCPHCGKPLE